MKKNLRLGLMVFVGLIFVSSGFWASCGPMPLEEEWGHSDGTSQEGGSSVDNGPESVVSEPSQDGGATIDAGESTASIEQSVFKEDLFPESISRLEVLSPSSFAPIELKETTWDFPAGGEGQTQLSFALYADRTPIFGGSKGLFVVEANAIVRVSQKKVIGLTSWKDGDVVVAYPDQLYLWDGKVLSPTNFFKNLDGSAITSVAFRAKESFWIGTEKSLWMLDNDQLQEFPQIQGVKTLLYAPNKNTLLVQDSKGALLALSELKGTWTTRSFAQEGVSLKVLTSTIEQDKPNFWGLDEQDTLLLRKVVSGDEAAWWGFRLKPDENDNETLSIQGVLFQYNPEQTWAITQDELYRLTEGVSRVLKRPAVLRSIATANSTLDGSIWLSDGNKLVRLGEPLPATTYTKDVEPIVQSKCLSCHKAGGRASFRPFETYQQVRDKAALILQRIDVQKNMPPGSPLPVAQIAAFKNWIAGGYQP